jgi:hypothetical protein
VSDRLKRFDKDICAINCFGLSWAMAQIHPPSKVSQSESFFAGGKSGSKQMPVRRERGVERAASAFRTLVCSAASSKHARPCLARRRVRKRRSALGDVWRCTSSTPSILLGQGMSLTSRLSSPSRQHGARRSLDVSATNSSPNRMSHLHVTPSTDEHRVSPGRQTNMCPFLRR